MKKFGETFRTFVFLTVATWLAYWLIAQHLDWLEHVALFLRLPKTALDYPNVIVPFLTAIIYILERVVVGALSQIPGMYKLHKLPLVGAAFDYKAIFVGTYLSLPANEDELNIFRIRFNSLSGKYTLTGYAFSLHNNEQIGYWKSDKLDMNTTEPVALSYIYEGKRKSEPDVRGHVHINFEAEKPYRSQDGYWVDVHSVGKVDWTKSHYVMLTPGVKSKIIQDRWFWDSEFPYLHIRRYLKRPHTIFKRLWKEALKDPQFKRPPPPAQPT